MANMDRENPKSMYPSLSTSISCHGTLWKLPVNYCSKQLSTVPLALAGSENSSYVAYTRLTGVKFGRPALKVSF